MDPTMAIPCKTVYCPLTTTVTGIIPWKPLHKLLRHYWKEHQGFTAYFISTHYSQYSLFLSDFKVVTIHLEIFLTMPLHTVVLLHKIEVDGKLVKVRMWTLSQINNEIIVSCEQIKISTNPRNKTHFSDLHTWLIWRAFWNGKRWEHLQITKSQSINCNQIYGLVRTFVYSHSLGPPTMSDSVTDFLENCSRNNKNGHIFTFNYVRYWNRKFSGHMFSFQFQQFVRILFYHSLSQKHQYPCFFLEYTLHPEIKFSPHI